MFFSNYDETHFEIIIQYFFIDTVGEIAVSLFWIFRVKIPFKSSGNQIYSLAVLNVNFSINENKGTISLWIEMRKHR
jgi:hypothetical protein